MRSVALATPFLLVTLIAIMGMIQARIDGTPYAFRPEGASGATGGFTAFFLAAAANARDAAEFRAVRGWFLLALGLAIATIAAITWLQGARWGAWVGLAAAFLTVGLFAILVAHGWRLVRKRSRGPR